MPKKALLCIDKLLMTCLVNLERIEPLSCEICDKIYCHEESLINHLTTHMKGEEIDNDIDDTMTYGESVTSEIDLDNALNTIQSKGSVLSIQDRIKFETEDTLDAAIRATCVKIQQITSTTVNDTSQSQDKSSGSNKHKLVPVEHMNLKRSYGKLHQCKTCNEKFAHHSSLELHEAICHNKLQHDSANPHKQIHVVDIQKQNGTKNIRGKYRKAFPSDRQLSLHSKVHDSWKCNTCKKTFNLQLQLERHQRTHTNKRPYSCVPCDLHFRNYSSLAYHYRDKHTLDEEKPTCDLCNLRYPVKHNLEKHILKVHMTKGYRCRICKTKKEYGHPLNLAKHMYMHNSNSHKCQYCMKTFTQKSHKERHVKLIHEKILNYECDMCRRKFGRKEHLVQHITNKCCLEPFKCKKCKSSYTKFEDLKKHRMKCKKKQRRVV